MTLIEQLQKAEGPSRELNIALASLDGLRVVEEGHPLGTVCYDKNGGAVPLPQYTSSIDAALTLVPGGWCWSYSSESGQAGLRGLVTDKYGHQKWKTATARGARINTPALAICAAALKARENNDATS